MRRLSATASAAAMLIAICYTPFFAPASAAETGATPTTKKLPNPTINVDVTEWVVFVADVANPELNARNLFHDSLPQFAEDLRTAAPAEDARASGPGPIGLIRVAADGPIDKDAALDVQLGFKDARALGHWPRAKVRSAGLLWQDLSLAPEPGEPHKLPEGSWLEQLRGGGLSLLAGPTRESFLLYDIELPYPVAIQVKSSEAGKYSVAHGMDAPLRDLTFYKRDADNHWRTATVANLSKAAGFPKPTAPAAAVTNADAANHGVPIRVQRTVVNGTVVTRTWYQNGTMVTTTANQPAANAESTPAASVAKPNAAIKGTEIALGPATETNDTVLAPWRAKLAEAGVSAADQEVVVKILARHALEPKRLTAVYRMDPAELDRILPLEVVPQPKKVSRIALVIVKGIDPAIGDELDQLIKKLGDPSWKIREAATTEIKKLGVRAKSPLEEAAKSKDTEIAFRAEQLLIGISNDPDHATDNGMNGAAQFQAGGFF